VSIGASLGISESCVVLWHRFVSLSVKSKGVASVLNLLSCEVSDVWSCLEKSWVDSTTWCSSRNYSSHHCFRCIINTCCRGLPPINHWSVVRIRQSRSTWLAWDFDRNSENCCLDVFQSGSFSRNLRQVICVLCVKSFKTCIVSLDCLDLSVKIVKQNAGVRGKSNCFLVWTCGIWVVSKRTYTSRIVVLWLPIELTSVKGPRSWIWSLERHWESWRSIGSEIARSWRNWRHKCHFVVWPFDIVELKLWK